jgi:hypothetical protein
MAIAFSCECGQQLQAKDEHAGRRTRCPKCGRDVMIPAIGPAPEPGPRPRPEAVTRRPRPDVSHLEEDDDWEERRPRRRRDAEARTSALAVTSLVLGILSFCFTALTGLPAIVLAVIALIVIGGSGGRVRGTGLAVGGLITGLLGSLLLLGLIPGVARVKQAQARIVSTNNLKQLALGMHNFNDTNGQLPPAVVYDRDGKPLYSWRVLLLPYVEEDALYREFHLDEPWDSPHNKALLPRMPKVYARPGEWPPKEPYATYYQVFDGTGAAFDSDKSKGLKPFNPGGVAPFGMPGPGGFGPPAGPSLMQGANVSRIPATFQDGTSNTIMIAEAGDPVPWSAPGDLHFDPNGPLPKLGGLFNGEFNVAMGDASVRYITKKTSERTLRAAITASGGEVLGSDW